jgi:hypothetical protein
VPSPIREELPVCRHVSSCRGPSPPGMLRRSPSLPCLWPCPWPSPFRRLRSRARSRSKRCGKPADRISWRIASECSREAAKRCNASNVTARNCPAGAAARSAQLCPEQRPSWKRSRPRPRNRRGRRRRYRNRRCRSPRAPRRSRPAGRTRRRPASLHDPGFHGTLLVDCAGQPRASAVPAGQCARALARMPERGAREPRRRRARGGSGGADCAVHDIAAGDSTASGTATTCDGSRSDATTGRRAEQAKPEAAQRRPFRLPVRFHRALLRRSAGRPRRAAVP